jgi:hypothetical protein
MQNLKIKPALISTLDGNHDKNHDFEKHAYSWIQNRGKENYNIERLDEFNVGDDGYNGLSDKLKVSVENYNSAINTKSYKVAKLIADQISPMLTGDALLSVQNLIKLPGPPYEDYIWVGDEDKNYFIVPPNTLFNIVKVKIVPNKVRNIIKAYNMMIEDQVNPNIIRLLISANVLKMVVGTARYLIEENKTLPPITEKNVYPVWINYTIKDKINTDGKRITYNVYDLYYDGNNVDVMTVPNSLKNIIRDYNNNTDLGLKLFETKIDSSSKLYAIDRLGPNALLLIKTNQHLPI